MHREPTIEEKVAAYDRMREGSQRGGLAEKHFTPESKERQIEGARAGGQAGKGKHKQFTEASLKKFSDNAKKNLCGRWHKKSVDK